MPDREQLKSAAAARALDLVKPGMVIGLGSGSTARYFVEGLGRLISQGLEVKVVPTSRDTADLARALGMSIVEDLAEPVDLDVDGADEIDPELQLIKGRGGALVREKLVAAAARRVVIIADGSKLVRHLGEGLLPVEILPFLWRRTVQQLELLRASCHLRGGGPTGPFVTDNGNLIVDLSFPEPIADPRALGARLKQIVGVVEHGIFVDLADACIVAHDDGVRVMGSLDGGDRHKEGSRWRSG